MYLLDKGSISGQNTMRRFARQTRGEVIAIATAKNTVDIFIVTTMDLSYKTATTIRITVATADVVIVYVVAVVVIIIIATAVTESFSFFAIILVDDVFHTSNRIEALVIDTPPTACWNRS